MGTLQILIFPCSPIVHRFSWNNSKIYHRYCNFKYIHITFICDFSYSIKFQSHRKGSVGLPKICHNFAKCILCILAYYQLLMKCFALACLSHISSWYYTKNTKYILPNEVNSSFQKTNPMWPLGLLWYLIEKEKWQMNMICSMYLWL